MKKFQKKNKYIDFKKGILLFSLLSIFLGVFLVYLDQVNLEQVNIDQVNIEQGVLQDAISEKFSKNVYANSKNKVVLGVFLDKDNSVKAKFNLKVAATPRERERGLMHVRAIKENEGMLFVYDEDIVMYFWMKNTYIPLDIVFLNNKFIVIGGIQNMLPVGGQNINDDDIPRYTIGRKARYAVELPSFSIKKHGIKVGDKLKIN